jgi:asparagine synthase (glutamine-hydrolysing)
VRHGCILTWDGRLDNRVEIRAQVQVGLDNEATDAYLVLAAYLTLGTNCFRELIGDWALALWDQTSQRLILARDSMGVRRLFYRTQEDGVAWCTVIEPLALTATRKLHPDLDYLAGCIYPRPPIESTAFLEIRSLVPASFLTFKPGGRHARERYWALNPHSKIRYATDRDYEEHFLGLFRESVHRRIRSDRTILAELSGGVDSTSILCMADAIRRQETGPSIQTLSFFDSEEPSGDERPFFELVERIRGNTGQHISISEFNRGFAGDALMPLPDGFFYASPGYTARSLRWAAAIDEVLSAVGARVLLSGVGGDEMLGGVQYEAPELADHLLAGRFISFLRAAFDWGLDRRKTVYSLIADALRLVVSPYRPQSLISEPVKPFRWVHLGASKRDQAFFAFSNWRRLPPIPLVMESVRFVLAQQLTCTDPPLIGCVERRYPYLDRELFAFLASIPRTQVLGPNRRRHLMRRALSGLVPEEILFRKTKWFGYRRPAATLNEEQACLEGVFKDPWLTDGVVVDRKLLREHLLAVQHGQSTEAIALRSAIGIEQWLRAQARLDTMDFDWLVPSRGTARKSAAMVFGLCPRARKVNLMERRKRQ